MRLHPLAVITLLLPLALPAAEEKPFGLERLPPVTTSTVVGSPDPLPPYRAKRVYPNYSPSYPIMVKPVPGTDQLLVITETSPYGETFLYRVNDNPAATDKDAAKLHDTKGVWIGDASAFPTAPGVNPMISIMALARRTAGKILEA